jgi:hypothetical protein
LTSNQLSFSSVGAASSNFVLPQIAADDSAVNFRELGTRLQHFAVFGDCLIERSFFENNPPLPGKVLLVHSVDSRFVFLRWVLSPARQPVRQQQQERPTKATGEFQLGTS